ncbi:hypothetical protein LJR164_001590 [Phenylobacterium sp. LjRoot164]|uniref:hypothetical protein n=1 Tax=unclassified Phenylobacterium TaxID=2640670 RepID=UPI003ECF474F
MNGDRLDHGYLNLPLSKRGDIDAQIDAHKAGEERARKASMSASHARVRLARALVRELSVERLAELGKPHNLTAKQALKMMLSAADSRPADVIASMSQEPTNG